MEELKRDELFQFVRWFNLMIGLYNICLWYYGAGFILLGIAMSNIAVWVFTRKVHLE